MNNYPKCEECGKQMRYKAERKLWWCNGYPDSTHEVIFLKAEKQSSLTVPTQTPILRRNELSAAIKKLEEVLDFFKSL